MELVLIIFTFLMLTISYVMLIYYFRNNEEIYPIILGVTIVICLSILIEIYTLSQKPTKQGSQQIEEQNNE